MGTGERAGAALVLAAERLAGAVDRLRFGPPVAYVYNPLRYARAAHRSYLQRFGQAPKRVVFLGMNPGPWGMAQTGVPFGEVTAVRDWMGIEEQVGQPRRTHPKRPVWGFSVSRSEASGKRLWTLIRQRFGEPEVFFRDHFVGNYCPLLFFDEQGRNITPDRLPPADRQELFWLCDEHLRSLLQELSPHWALGIGRFAERRIRIVRDSGGLSALKVEGILHPSPANPQANRGWEARTEGKLESLGIW
jgi:single-strand selective monofunctional uracil DNA glycosylase